MPCARMHCEYANGPALADAVAVDVPAAGVGDWWCWRILADVTYSMAMFLPSTWPSSRSFCRNAST